jgi:hypothetical protein
MADRIIEAILTVRLAAPEGMDPSAVADEYAREIGANLDDVRDVAAPLVHPKQARIIERHQQDEDCRTPSALFTKEGGINWDGCCEVCGAFHGEPCASCGGRAYHRLGCPAVPAGEGWVEP